MSFPKILPASLLIFLAACQPTMKSQISNTSSQPTTTTLAVNTPTPPINSRSAAESPAPSGKISNLSDSDLHDALSYLDNAHHDKMKLAFWVGTPLLRSADPVFKTFYEEQGKKQKELADQLESYAKAHHLDVTYHDGPDVFGVAQKIMSDRQEKTVRADNKEDFGRDMLIDELQDYEFCISLITALEPHIQDQTLKTYLETSLHSHEAADIQIKQLIKRYKFN